MLQVILPGLQSTLQGTPRMGFRHQGVPFSGAADPLSMALANWLAGNTPSATAIEITYGGFQAKALSRLAIGVSGAATSVSINGEPQPSGKTLLLQAGDVLDLPHSSIGMRSYLAVQGGFQAEVFLGSPSTYLPANLGGFEGRALKAGDEIAATETPDQAETRCLPAELQPAFGRSFALRTCPSAEFDLLTTAAQHRLFTEPFKAGQQATRMGLALEGQSIDLASDGLMQSAPVFPGTIQCPQGGTPIMLLCDAQTTGGYPRIAQIARCDRHLLGQIRPGDQVRLLKRTADQAATDHDRKQQLIRSYLPDFEL